MSKTEITFPKLSFRQLLSISQSFICCLKTVLYVMLYSTDLTFWGGGWYLLLSLLKGTSLSRLNLMFCVTTSCENKLWRKAFRVFVGNCLLVKSQWERHPLLLTFSSAIFFKKDNHFWTSSFLRGWIAFFKNKNSSQNWDARCSRLKI